MTEKHQKTLVTTVEDLVAQGYQRPAAEAMVRRWENRDRLEAENAQQTRREQLRDAGILALSAADVAEPTLYLLSDGTMATAYEQRARVAESLTPYGHDLPVEPEDPDQAVVEQPATQDS